MEDWVVIKYLKAINPDKSNREIARNLGISHNTVKAVLDRNRAPKNPHNGPINSELEIFHKVIYELLNIKNFKCSRIFNELKLKGFKGGKTTMYIYLSKMKIKAQKFSTPNLTEPKEKTESNRYPYSRLYKYIEIVVLYKYLKSINKISRLTGYCRKTIRKVLKQGTQQNLRLARVSILDNYKDYILKLSEEVKTSR